MSKHTPGPWFPCCATKLGLSECHCGYIFGPGEKTIAKVDLNDKRIQGYEPMEGEITIEEHNANAFLIAAAPLMLAALKEAYDEDHGGYSGEQVKAAILAADPDAFDAEGDLRG